MAPTKTLDTITLRNLHTTCCIGPDAWSRPGKPQPLILTLNLQLDTSAAGVSDDIGNTFSYGTMCKDILAKVEGGQFGSMAELMAGMAEVAKGWPGEDLRIVAVAPKALLRVEGGLRHEVLLRRSKMGLSGWVLGMWGRAVEGLKVACIIGVNSHERLEKQAVVIELRFGGEGGEEQQLHATYSSDLDAVSRSLVKHVCEAVESSAFQTLEALAALIAEMCLQASSLSRVTVSVEKPSALSAVEGAGVEITRDRQWLKNGGDRQRTTEDLVE